jgi:hypothetical protein
MPLNEGQTVQYTVTTTRVPDGTTLYWKTTGNTTNSDIVGGNTGSITITNNRAVFNVTILADETTEGTKTLGIAVATGSSSGPTVVTTPAPIIVNDTSQTPFAINYLLVAGGGPSGRTGNGVGAGGGGAGGYLTGNTTSVLSGTPYAVTVGAGGTGIKVNGANTTFAGLTAIGGGAGGDWVSYQYNGNNGGSGGGSYDSVSSGTIGQGFAGGTGSGNGTGAGGGAAQVGNNSGQYLSPASGNGGNGKQWFNGNYYAGGGAGAYWNTAGGSGGLGGGGSNSYFEQGNGAANTGGGGAASTTDQYERPPYLQGLGGSGIVVLRYLGTPVATGGTITQTGGYTYHTFTSSDTFTLN